MNLIQRHDSNSPDAGLYVCAREKKTNDREITRVYMPGHTIQSERVSDTEYIRGQENGLYRPANISPRSAKVTNTHTP